MKSLFLLLLLLPAVSFSQGIVGKWEGNYESPHTLEFTADGTMILIYTAAPDAPFVKDMKQTYILSAKGNKTYFTWTPYFKGEKLNSEKTEYKLDGDTLLVFKNIKERNAEGKMAKPVLVYKRIKE